MIPPLSTSACIHIFYLLRELHIEYIHNIEIYSLNGEGIYLTNSIESISVNYTASGKGLRIQLAHDHAGIKGAAFLSCAWEGKVVFEAIGYEDSRKGESMLGLLGYYEAILERNGLVTRIGEIRSLKLGLTLDLLRMVNIGEDLKAKLISALVSAWEMKGNDDVSEEGEEEIRTMLSSIAAVRKNAQATLHNCSPKELMQLDVAVMFALPLMPHDLKNDDVPKIRDFLNQVMENFADRKQQEFAPCP
jgi:hypothetical protein